VEAIRTGSHPSGGWLLSAFFLVVPGRRGRSTPFCRLNAMQQQPSAFSPRLWAERTSGAARHRHRRARRLFTGHRAAQSRGGSEEELPASTGAISQQRSGTGSSGDQSPDTRKPAFSLVLGSLAHDPRLRSDPYDPQKARCTEARTAAKGGLLHCFILGLFVCSFVQRGDGLILRTLSPNFALTPKLQHYRWPSRLRE
jgi:hypothetical protein